ncbi:hypothetical protein GMDG_04500 [Pseudogymnoascus destructans 20631-21]|uniref:CCHC-type domain-containing protein n=1 Tax=Pseudogymnoascus destructans (strain ATCC MYA-4855 / 20631-21) TaxID=658429 RepID=L8GA98_PSED2|nr:hypothetical protein GMDG_04500 [Pseudogymnoascus destructans 20631-21]
MRKTTSNIPQDNDGQPSRMTTRQTTAAATTAVPSEDIPDRMAFLEAQVQEIKDLLVTLAATQTRIPSTPPVDTPIPTVEVAERRTSPMRNTPETVQLPPLRNTRSPSIPRMYSEDPPNRYKKSTISEKITPLSDGIEHTFMQWSASIRDRLVVNEDHYPTDVSRRALIWGTTTGLAKKYLEPQYLSATHAFRSADEMMDLLGSYFLTGNETEQARNLFDDLQMGEKGHVSETFPEFKARFQSAAITGQVNESEWFRYMWNKLTPQFRSRVAVIKSQWKGDYYTMVRELTAFDQERRRNNELSPLPALARTSTRSTDTAKASASKPMRTTPAPFTRTTFLPKPAIPERVRTAVPAAPGNCFKCGKPGHFQDKCPLNATVKEIDRNDPEAEEQWEEAVELQSDASLEENDEA